MAFIAGRIYLRYNVVTGRVECKAPLVPPNWGDDTAQDISSPSGGRPGGGCWTPLNDRIVNSLWKEMSQQQEKVVRVQDMYRVIESDFVPEFHPFRYYLEHLPPWDGQSDYILEMSVSVNVRGDVQEQLLFAEYLKKWLVGMVAGWLDAKVVNNVILVLIGEQGSYKTTWFNYLLPPELSNYFYTKTNAQRMGRDDLLTLAQYGLVCCEELDTMRPSELNQLKAAVTMPSIDERAAYAHFHEHRMHIASFCGTGNNVQCRRVSIRSTTRASMRRPTPSIRRASATGSRGRRFCGCRRTTRRSRRRTWSVSSSASGSVSPGRARRASSSRPATSCRPLAATCRRSSVPTRWAVP